MCQKLSRWSLEKHTHKHANTPVLLCCTWNSLRRVPNKKSVICPNIWRKKRSLIAPFCEIILICTLTENRSLNLKRHSYSQSVVFSHRIYLQIIQIPKQQDCRRKLPVDQTSWTAGRHTALQKSKKRWRIKRSRRLKWWDYSLGTSVEKDVPLMRCWKPTHDQNGDKEEAGPTWALLKVFRSAVSLTTVGEVAVINSVTIQNFIRWRQFSWYT